MAGFPWHPHRGIETVTYMLDGRMEHQDSMGNRGVIESGDIQWMTAGSGIIHSEMPGQDKGTLWGLQLWVNLPSGSKMMHPRYRDIVSSAVPEVTLEGGARVKVICGSIGGVTGAAKEIIADPRYFDVTVPPGGSFSLPVPEGYTVFAYVLEGSGIFHPGGVATGKENLVIYERSGDSLMIQGDGGGLRFILVSGKPIGEPVAWYGPIVMNSQEELDTAFREYRDGTFLKHS